MSPFYDKDGYINPPHCSVCTYIACVLQCKITDKKEQPRYIFYYPFEIFVLSSACGFLSYSKDRVGSSPELCSVCTELKTIKFGKMEALAFTAVEGSDLCISLIFPLGFQIANTGVVLLHFCSYFSLPMRVTFPACYTMLDLLNQLFEETADFVRLLSLTN